MFGNDSEENWVIVLWSDETKNQLFGNSTQLAVFGGGGMLPMTPRTPSPPSNMGMETLCFGGVFLLRGKDNCTASKGRWKGPCAVRARALKPARALKMGLLSENVILSLTVKINLPLKLDTDNFFASGQTYKISKGSNNFPPAVESRHLQIWLQDEYEIKLQNVKFYY